MNRPSAPAAHDPASTPPVFRRTICLVGFMGAGKTTLGEALAQRLDRGFTDLDRAIETHSGRSVAEIFAGQGEEAFRALEREVLRQVLQRGGVRVLAVGGGAFAQAEVRSLLKEHGALTVFLDAPVEELYRRCVDSLGAAPRPLLKDLPSFSKLYAERLPFYRGAERHVSTAHRPVAAVRDEILGMVQAAEAKRKDP